jgi:hypothetical protein
MAMAKAQPAFERDPVRLDPKHYKVEMDNERVRLVRISYGPHDKSPMHQHRPGIVIFLTDTHFKFSYPDGKTEDIQGKAGEYRWFDQPWEHLPENLSGQKFEALYLELKS